MAGWNSQRIWMPLFLAVALGGGAAVVASEAFGVVSSNAAKKASPGESPKKSHEKSTQQPQSNQLQTLEERLNDLRQKQQLLYQQQLDQVKKQAEEFQHEIEQQLNLVNEAKEEATLKKEKQTQSSGQTPVETKPGAESKESKELQAVEEDRREVVQFGTNVVLQSGERAQNVIVFGGDVEIFGTVVNDVVVFGGDLIVHPFGRIKRDVVTFGGNVHVKSGAWVGNNVNVFGGSLTTDEGGRVENSRVVFGALIQEKAKKKTKQLKTWLKWVNWFSLVFVFMVGGYLWIRFGGPPSIHVAGTLKRRPVYSMFIGVLALLLSLPVMLIFVVSILGIPLMVVLGLLISVAVFVGYVAVGEILGGKVTQERLDVKRFKHFVVGAVLLIILFKIPFVGKYLWAMVGCSGFGAVLLAIKKRSYTSGIKEPPALTQDGSDVASS